MTERGKRFMPGEFYTERDIVDLVRGGARRLELKEGDRMTDLARDRAAKEGLEIVGPYEIPEQAARRAASTRYAAQGQGEAPLPSAESEGDPSEIHQRVRKAVISKLGDQVDTPLLDDIIRRVMRQVGRR